MLSFLFIKDFVFIVLDVYSTPPAGWRACEAQSKCNNTKFVTKVMQTKERFKLQGHVYRGHEEFAQ